jgi:hypothetical protein
MPTAGFEPTIPASERPQTNPLDRAATAIGILNLTTYFNISRHLLTIKYTRITSLVQYIVIGKET